MPSQTGFIQNRSILDDSVIMASEAVEWVVESDQNQIIMLLDFEKAYDRISWSVMEDTMGVHWGFQKYASHGFLLYIGMHKPQL